jgi:hypothetical protein
MKYVLSLGAGVQSSTLALMFAKGEFEYMPDCAIFADTQAEPLEVYEWLEWLKSQLPFPLYIVSKGNLSEDILKVKTSKEGRKYIKMGIPVHTLKNDGSSGMMFRHCTFAFKINPIHKQVKKLYGKENVNMLLGISIDEAIRMKPSRVKNIVNQYPLIDKGMTRNDCLRWMESNQYPKPPRSACVFCPYHSNHEWHRLKTEYPNEFQKAVEFEKQMQFNADGILQTIPFLHPSLKSLDTVQFKDEKQVELFGNECEGMCGI